MKKTIGTILNILMIIFAILIVFVFLWNINGSLEAFPTQEQTEKVQIVTTMFLILLAFLECGLFWLKGLVKNDWKEIYSTMKEEKYVQAKNILSENRIDYTTDMLSDSIRAAVNSRFRSNIPLGENGGIRTIYKLSVHGSEKEKAIHRLKKEGVL